MADFVILLTVRNPYHTHSCSFSVGGLFLRTSLLQTTGRGTAAVPVVMHCIRCFTTGIVACRCYRL